MSQLTAIDDGFVKEEEIIVGTDSRGFELSSFVLAERLTQLDCYDIIADAKYKDYQYVGEVLGRGFRGYHNMSPGELWTEFKEKEDQFYELFDLEDLPCKFDEEPAKITKSG